MRFLFAPLIFCALGACSTAPQTAPGTSVTAPGFNQALAVYDACVGLEAGINAAAIAQQNGILPIKPQIVDGAVLIAQGPCTDPGLLASDADLSRIVADLIVVRFQFPTASDLTGQADKSAKPNKAILATQFLAVAANLAIRISTATASSPRTVEAKQALGQNMAVGMERAISTWTTVRGNS